MTNEMYKRIWQWTPFTYIIEGFEGNEAEVGGVFPADAREKCDFFVKRVHGPIVVGFWSYIMNTIIEISNKP